MSIHLAKPEILEKRKGGKGAAYSPICLLGGMSQTTALFTLGGSRSWLQTIVWKFS